MTLPAWLQSVHHDGSEKYVADLYPRLGDTVRVRLRVGADAPVRRAYLRTFPDGEQFFAPMDAGPVAPPARWWEADLPINQPVVHYRFILEADDGAWWYTAAGPTAAEPLDATDFRILADYDAAAWVPNAVFYQIFPDRFANGDPATNPRPDEFEYRGHRPQTYPWGAPPPTEQFMPLLFYGGDLPGIVQRLDYLEALGVNALYLNPVFAAHSNHKYDVMDYEHVDPHLGGDEALIALRRALDARGMRYILDIVPNHCGYWHTWFQAARADPAAPEADFFTFAAHPDEYATWLGMWTLPKLDYRSAELRRRIYEGPDAVFRRWLRPPFAADGWRVDVANMLARQGATQMGADITRGIRRAVKETRPDAYLMGEHFFDATPHLQGDQWDGVMNYLGFALPLWYWLRGFERGGWGLDEPITAPVHHSWPTAALADTWRNVRAAIPWAVALQQYNLLGSHDTPRIRTVVGGSDAEHRDALHRLATVLLFTFPGTPGLYYGDEIGLTDQPGLRSRGCMVWDEAQWDHSLLAFTRNLVALRRRSPALQHGGFQMLAVERDTLAYQREGLAGRVLVVAHRCATPRPAGPLPVAHGGIPNGTRLGEVFSGQEAVVKNGALALPELPQGATIWET
ncbi:MAG: maltodextrin glucosidase [Chloroflexi bacterium]|nr:maltodextrin glucosidase [Chloroflexota bacterium]MBU1751424.1 maltodextrin glucosidase [Chloroflexota bacterium]